MNDINYDFLSWANMEGLCADIHFQMILKKYKPDCIIGLSRGGIVPARLFSDYFDVVEDVFSLDIKMYTGIKSVMEEAVIRPFHDDVKGKKILIVDDIWDSGMTMRAVLKYLQGEDLTTATLYKNPKVVDGPNYYGTLSKEGTWVVFPWEKEETKREMLRLKTEKE